MTRILRLLRWRPGRLAMNALRGSTMYGVRLAAQALYFLLLARSLGVHQFGLFSGIWVLCGFLATFSGLGFPVLAFRSASLTPAETSACAARGLRVMAMTALPLIVLLVGISTTQFVYAPALPTLVLLAFSEIILVPMLTLLSSMHQGNERLGRAHLLFASLWITRLLGLAVLMLATSPVLRDVVLVHSGITVLLTVGWLIVDRNLLHPPLRISNPARAEVLTGLSFAVSGAAVIAFTELNQSITLAFAGATAAGLLAVAYKVVMLISAPLSALCQAISPRLLRAAHSGAAFSDIIRNLVWPLFLFAAVCCAVAFVLAGFIPLVFGPNYEDARSVARAICILPLISSARLVSSYILVAASRQRNRVVAELACLAIGLPLNAWLISEAGLPGAVAGILIMEGTIAVILAVLAYRIVRGSRESGGFTSAI